MTMIGLPDSATLLGAFVVASLVLAVSPGPGVLYIVTRSLAQGRRAGLLSVAGVAAGNLCNALAAAFGLAALFAVSSTAFAIVKYAGAAYLVVLGVKALLAGSRPAGPLEAATLPRRRSLLRDGFLVALLNPKTTLFFAAFLPQFMDASAPPMLQGAALGALFVAIAACTDSAYALAAGTLGARIGRSAPLRRYGRYLSGATLIGLGLVAALGGSRGTAPAASTR